ncbi:hypothetical protein [uncultured Lacinutrix sp.]|uniref:helix-turn-helix transcriptional regulator n=1 Tax=uncultured Lacinutrix sp. TaxID=574032 RepID=UPI002612FEBB|nr:hypothetical protein [uncultured Lacinutrix sp.]
MAFKPNIYFNLRSVPKTLVILFFLFAKHTLANTQEIDFCKIPNLTIEELNSYVNKDWFKVLHEELEIVKRERQNTYTYLQENTATNIDDFKTIVLYVWYAELSNRVQEFEDTNLYFHKALSLALKKNSNRYIYFVTVNYVRHLRTQKIYQPAQKMLEELLDIFNNNCSNDDLINSLRTMELLSSIANETGKWTTCESLLKEMITIIEGKQLKSFRLSTFYNNLGYLQLKQLQNIVKAETYFNKSLETLSLMPPSKNPQRDTLAMWNVRENLAHVYVKKKNYKAAEDLYINTQRYRTKHNIKSIRAKLYLAELYLNYYSDSTFINYMNDLLLTYKDTPNVISKSDKLKFSNLLNSYSKKDLKDESKSSALDLSAVLLQSYYEEKSKAQISFSKSYFSTIQKDVAEKLKIESQLLKNEKRNSDQSKVILILLIIILISIAIAARIYITRIRTQKNSQKIKAELAEMKLVQSKLELDANKSLLDNIKSDNLVKNQLLKTWLKELKDIGRTKDILDIKKHVKSLIINTNERLNDTSAYNHIIENLDEANPLFQKKLISKFPNLTKREIQFCLLIHLDRSRSEIMSLMNVNLNAYKSTQNRIRRKLELDKSITLRDFIKDF